MADGMPIFLLCQIVVPMLYRLLMALFLSYMLYRTYYHYMADGITSIFIMAAGITNVLISCYLILI